MEYIVFDDGIYSICLKPFSAGSVIFVISKSVSTNGFFFQSWFTFSCFTTHLVNFYCMPGIVNFVFDFWILLYSLITIGFQSAMQLSYLKQVESFQSSLLNIVRIGSLKLWPTTNLAPYGRQYLSRDSIYQLCYEFLPLQLLVPQLFSSLLVSLLLFGVPPPPLPLGFGQFTLMHVQINSQPKAQGDLSADLSSSPPSPLV